MIDGGAAAAFFAASVLLALAPGPDNIFVLLHAAMHGRRAGFHVVLGLCCGLLVHTAAVAVGLAALFAASKPAFTALQALGAAYLCYLAWRVLRARPQPIAGTTPAARPRAMFLRGIAMNLSNPKVIIFFLAFLPQFTRPERGHLAVQTIELGALFIAATLIVFGAVAYFAGAIGEGLRRSPRRQLVLTRAAAMVFIALAARLVFATV